jgi:hypothetical protein
MISTTWLFILVAVAISFGFRALPVFFKNKLEGLEDSYFVIFLNYTACAIIGSIIYVIAFHSQDIVGLYHGADRNDLLKVLILAASFVINVRLKNPITTFFICIAAYAALSFFLL